MVVGVFWVVTMLLFLVCGCYGVVVSCYVVPVLYWEVDICLLQHFKWLLMYVVDRLF